MSYCSLDNQNAAAHTDRTTEGDQHRHGTREGVVVEGNRGCTACYGSSKTSRRVDVGNFFQRGYRRVMLSTPNFKFLTLSTFKR